MNAPVVMERQVPSFQVAQKTAEISQVQFIDRVVRFFCRATDSVPTVQTVQKIVQITQMQFLEKGMTIPVVVQHQVSMVQVVQKTAWKKSTMNFKANASSYSSVQTVA